MEIMKQEEMGGVVNEVNALLSKLEESIGMEEFLSTQHIKPSIYKIPQFIREVNPKAYEPKLVSLGPYHYGKPHLLPMEREKHKAFLHFKARNNLYLESIVDSVCSILEDLLGSYDDNLDDRWKEDVAMFLKLMIVDGCFVLDLISELSSKSLGRCMIWDIKRDMVLLENQLPLQLLKQLHALTTTNENEKENLDLEAMIWSWMGLSGEILSMRSPLHILDIYRSSLLSPTRCKQDETHENTITILEWTLTNEENVEYCQSNIRSATQLRKAGIKFEKSSTNNLMDVSFDFKQRVLRLPSLAIDDILTEPTLINIMAFEKLHVGVERQVTSFVVLMKNLIGMEKDVSLLASKGILSSNVIHDGNGVVQLFNVLAKGQTKYLESHMYELFRMLNCYHDNRWSIWLENLKLKVPQTKNSWQIISIALFTFGFTYPFVQAITDKRHRRKQ
ncbi:UPF0481 protein At3g47200 [Cucumis sativus]|uniref:UPF0481 protein At3g47200 n=1 Tax=Cucumis sativus TaxID=3659 RepID=UPI0002B44968|nr:UPF0481 protein At3g47200 [Cucumis sativus]KAE8646751.1 hypothetical protein Csa_005047 [Cucumis sativus]